MTGLDGTTMHEEGQAAASELTVTGVHNAKVELGEGNDLIAVVGASLPGHLAIHTGTGDDRVLVGTGGDAAELVGVMCLSACKDHSTSTQTAVMIKCLLMTR